MDNSKRYFMNKNEILENTEQAFEEEQFLVYFQPQYNYTSKKNNRCRSTRQMVSPTVWNAVTWRFYSCL